MNDVGPDEVLVVLSGNDVARVRSQIEQEMLVLHSVSPGMFVVAMTPQAIDYLGKIGNEATFTASAVSPTVLRTLNEQERQWVAAWNLRRSKKPQRPGEGLPWDAPGFSPPDRPNSDNVASQTTEKKEQ